MAGYDQRYGQAAASNLLNCQFGLKHLNVILFLTGMRYASVKACCFKTDFEQTFLIFHGHFQRQKENNGEHQLV